jgi:hypothetical protein
LLIKELLTIKFILKGQCKLKSKQQTNQHNEEQMKTINKMFIISQTKQQKKPTYFTEHASK